MKYYTFLFLFVSVFISCKSKPTDPRPKEQMQYLQTISKYQDDYKKANGNDVSQEEITTTAKSFLNEKITIQNWVGRVEEVGKNGNPLNDYYEKKYVTLSLFPWDITYSVTEKIPYDGANVKLTIYNIDDQTASSLRKGQNVTFSCSTVKEKSITDKGALEQPEVVAEATGNIQVMEQ